MSDPTTQTTLTDGIAFEPASEVEQAFSAAIKARQDWEAVKAAEQPLIDAGNARIALARKAYTNAVAELQALQAVAA